MEGNRETCVVLDGRIRTCYFCFAYKLASTVSFVFSKGNNKSATRVPKFRVNSLSIVSHSAIHNLPTFISVTL